MKEFRGQDSVVQPFEDIKNIEPERVLDAPGMVDDFYLNLLDWSDHNILAVALGNVVYLMNVTDKRISTIQPKNIDRDEIITSLSWSKATEDYLAIGIDSGVVEIWDTSELRMIRALSGHLSRVSALSWNQNILSTGSLDSSILNHDIRQRNNIVSRFDDHTKEVCGLKWSFDGQQLASGSNDNTLCIWDINKAVKPKFTLHSHRAAVKGLAWCPLERNLLASGGGTKDKSIKFWDTDTGHEQFSLKTSAQICSLIWAKNSKEIISSHGYEKNELFVWKYNPHIPEMPLEKTAELTGHRSRVLHLAISPSGTTIASTAPDETLRFWKVFQDEDEFSLLNACQNGNSLFRDIIR